MEWIKQVNFNEAGLIPAIAQDHQTQKVLMVAWMNHEALQETVKNGYATYWSRSRKKLWRKGEESGHRQKVHGIFLDCDGDVILLSVEQLGGIACHTGHPNCFYTQLVQTGDGKWDWQEIDQVLKDPDLIYRH